MICTAVFAGSAPAGNSTCAVPSASWTEPPFGPIIPALTFGFDGFGSRDGGGLVGCGAEVGAGDTEEAAGGPDILVRHLSNDQPKVLGSLERLAAVHAALA